jgi:DNA invertase Pin-like site-specific DNA recombinase
VSTTTQGETGLRVEARGGAALSLGPIEQIAHFVEVESGKRSDRRQPAAAIAKKRKVTLLVAELDRLSRSVAFIATLMDSRGFDLAIADMPERKATRRSLRPQPLTAST